MQSHSYWGTFSVAAAVLHLCSLLQPSVRSHPHTTLHTPPCWLATEMVCHFAAIRQVVTHVLLHGMNFRSLCWESFMYLTTPVSKIKQITQNYSSDLILTNSWYMIRRFADSTCQVNFILKIVPLRKETFCHKHSRWQGALMDVFLSHLTQSSVGFCCNWILPFAE